MERPILLFDGICNLCNEGVRFLIDRDRRPGGTFRYASLQSRVGQSLLREHGLPTEDFDSFVMIDEGQLLTKSTAALKVARRLGGVWALVAVFEVIPRFLRDPLYDLVARVRYRVFGRREHCRLPSAEEAILFLDVDDADRAATIEAT